jgi:hypothetical protein
MTDWPKPPAHVGPYVNALGHELAADFLLNYGGGEIYLSDTVTSRSSLLKSLSYEQIGYLLVELGIGMHRVPLAPRWVARVLVKKGLPVAQIARKLRKTENTVRSYTSHERAEGDPRQLDLFSRPD